MKRNAWIWFGLVVLIITAGCGNNPAAPDNNTYISVIMQQNETSGMSVTQFVVYAADSDGTTKTSAVISMAGPSGALAGSMVSGVFILQEINGSAFQTNAEYAVSVTVGASEYYATVLTNGPVTIAADGSTVTWGYDADVELITVTTPVSSFLYYGTALNSPFDLNAAGAYAAGTGTYSISATMTDNKDMTVVTGTEVVWSAIIQHMTSLQVSK